MQRVCISRPISCISLSLTAENLNGRLAMTGIIIVSLLELYSRLPALQAAAGLHGI